jgi:holin-like protein
VISFVTEKGYFVTKIVPWREGGLTFTAPVDLDTLIRFTQKLSAMLKAGITLLAALRMLWAQTEHKRLQVIISEMITDISQGVPFSECLKKFFEMRIPGPVIGLILLLITLIFLKRYKTSAINNLKSDVLNTSNYILSYLSLLFVPIGVGVVMHLSYLENNLFKVLIIVFISTVLTIGITAFLMEKINKRINKK